MSAAIVRAPEVCETCAGDGFLVATFHEGDFQWPCPACQCCPICTNSSPGGGECGECFTDREVTLT